MSEARSAEDIIALKSEDLYNYGHQVKILSLFHIHYRINNPKEYCLSVLIFFLLFAFEAPPDGQ